MNPHWCSRSTFREDRKKTTTPTNSQRSQRQCGKMDSYFSLFLSTIEMGLGGHKNREVFRETVGEGFSNKIMFYESFWRCPFVRFLWA
jgi:hypothetical protein